MRYYVTLPSGLEIAVDVQQRPAGRIDVRIGEQTFEVDAVEAERAINVRVDERVFDLWLERGKDRLGFVCGGLRAFCRVESDRSRLGERASRPGGVGGGYVTAPMPGRVVKILVKEGDEVDAGAPVIVVEAMKMENELLADKAGRVARILAAPGQTVEGGALLVELGPLEDR
jgi:glutaconyl-CoA/methylmalonyl-CoA decarboxylase subunit gamma